MAKGLIFDMDGTMVDNMMVHHRAWQVKLKEMGMEMPIEEVMEKVHGVNEEILERLFGDRYSAEERKMHSFEKEEAYRKIYKNEIKLIEGIKDLFEKMKSQGIPMAIGTAAPEGNANFILDELNLRSYFQGIFHAGHVKKGKPDPEVFQLAADSMGLSTSECLIFEDSITGAEAARRAGAKAIIINTTHRKEEFKQFDHIVAFINDYNDLDLDPYLAN